MKEKEIDEEKVEAELTEEENEIVAHALTIMERMGTIEVTEEEYDKIHKKLGTMRTML